MKYSIFLIDLFLHTVHCRFSTRNVQIRLDKIPVVVIAGAEVHVHETVVDAVVLHMKKVVVGVKVVSARVLRLLGVSELVVDAVLNDESVKRSRNETKDDSG